MTREEAAEILKRSVEELNDVLDGVTMNECTEATIRRNIDAYSMAVDALLEKVGVSDINVGKSEPLTLNELREMDNQPVWIEDVGEYKWHGSGWAIVDLEHFLVRKTSNGNPAFFERYGKEWIAYRQKTEEEHHDSDGI